MKRQKCISFHNRSRILGGLKRKILIALTAFAVTSFAGCISNSELEWNEEQGYRWTDVNPGFWDETGFQNLPASKTNITFVNHLSDEQIAGNRNLLNGSGVAAGDIDGDGLVDLYFAQLEGPNTLYRNMGGFKFKDITELAGVAHQGYYSTGVVFADVDGDEDLDLLVTSLGQQNALYINDGQGHFNLKTDSGLGASRGSTTMTLADIDGDNDLDLYVTNYKEKSLRDLYSVTELTLENIVHKNGTEYSLKSPFDRDYELFNKNGGKPEARELGEMDELYINEGSGTFHKIPDLSKRFFSADGQPVGLERDWGLAAKFQDINGDLLPDLYVCNDFWTPDRVWINQGNGTFKAIDNLSIRKFSFSSMGVDFSDINRDGFLDIFVTEMLSPLHQQRMRQFVTQSPFFQTIGDINHQVHVVQNTLQLNRGDNTYVEIAYFSGVEATGWSWATKFLDIDLDGYEDLLITTGNAYDFQDLDTQEQLSRKIAQSQQEVEGYILDFPSLELPNMAFQNNQDRTFSDAGSEWGFDEKDISNGMAAADLDNDGDLDLAVNRLNQEASIYENKTTASRIAVRLKGNSPNTQGIGAVVKLSGGPVIQQKQIVAGGDYVSGSDPLVMFAAKEENTNHKIEVIWPDGDVSTIDHVKANTIYEISEISAKTVKRYERSQQNKSDSYLFKDISDRIGHNHHEQPFDDFSIQPLLPVKLSQLGPGLSWIDFDRDGDDDLFITSGKGGKPGVLENNGDGTFRSRDLGALTDATPGDETTILGWGYGKNTTLIVGRSNYEQGYLGSVSANFYTLNGDQVVNHGDVPPVFSATGPLAAADYDGDDDLDLFVGGRFVPGHYPMDASSRLYININDGEGFKLDKINSGRLHEVGLVTGAVFSDYDQDGDPDLLLSTEWGPVKLFRNINGEYQEVTRLVGLDQFKGWWNGVATGDFNGDGYPDIIATNAGLNSSYRLDSGQPLKIYYDDFDRDRRMEILEAYYDETSRSYVPRRQLYDLDRSIPAITRSIKTHHQFAQSSLQEILGTELEKIPSKEINTLEHMLFINNGDNFSAHPLPDEAQWSTAFYAGVADYDNDGNEDLFISQNFFGFPPTVPRQDAGRGLWLRGDGNGHLTPVSGHKTGIKVYGEQRGAALGDLNRDGKVDLAVSQNGASTKLYLNQSNKPGIRVHLVGPEENTQGIGSSLRIVYENGNKGPRREIQAGSGYWSQNSTTQIMGTQSTPKEIEVTWYDGIVQYVQIEQDKREYRIQYPDL